MSPPVPLLVDEYLIAPLPELWFGILLFCLAMYLFLDGFDFGLGMVYATRSDDEEKELLLQAFGPVWDANEVWIVAFGTVLIAAFPQVYAALLSDHYLLVIAFVFALLARGLGPEFRELNEDPDWQRRCDRLFVGGSILAPFCLGILAGGWVFGTGIVGLASVLTGTVVVALALVGGVAYTALKAQGELRQEMLAFRWHATAVYLTTLVLLLAVLLVQDPLGVRIGLLTPTAIALVVVVVGGPLVGAQRAVSGDRRLWIGSCGVSAFGLVALLGTLLYPSAYPVADLTVREAVVAPVSLNLLTLVGGPLFLFVLGYFVYLYTVFSGSIEEGEGYGH